MTEHPCGNDILDVDPMASICPRCGSQDTNRLGASLCPGDRFDRIPEMGVYEFICNNCGLFYKQVNCLSQTKWARKREEVDTEDD